MKKYIPYIFLFILIFPACTPARKFPEGQYLLRRNIVIIHNLKSEKSKSDTSHRAAGKNKKINTAVSADELTPYIKQKQNRKQLLTWLRVRIYNGTSRGKDTKVKRWFQNTFGSEPVILDTSLTDASVKQISMYLNNKGYFNSRVYREIKKCKYHARQVKIKYYAEPAPPYYIRNIKYSISDATVKALVYSDKARTLIRSGEQYDVDKLSAERDRITSDLTNYGYFYFSSEFIRYKIDSSLNSHQIDLIIEIVDPMIPAPGNPDSLVKSTHKRYHINNIYISTDYNPMGADTIKSDTVKIWVPNRRKHEPPKAYYFVYHDKLKIKPKTLTQQIFIDSSDFYTFRDVEKTQKQLYDLKSYRFINILFKELPESPESPHLLNCQILLSRLPIQAFAVEAQVTNRGGDLGIAGDLVYENRNLFRGAENFNFKLTGALEIAKLSFNAKKEERALKNIPIFNTIQAGTEINLKLPRFLLPVHQERFSKNFRPKTNFGAGFNYEQQPDFIRYVTKGSFGYEWKESVFKTHILTPLEVNSVIIHPDSTFAAKIDALTDRTAQNAYKNHLITSLKYSFIYNTQQVGKNQNFMYFRGNFEVAGFLFWLYSSIKGTQGSYTLLNIPYSQYWRIDADYSYYFFINDRNSIATRAMLGIGGPMDKYNSLPFEKNFYLGGANSMRGWRLRQLGPGSYHEPDSLSFDNIGDIGLELNAEYRFPIYKYFKGGLFIDAGNVWLRKKNDLYPGGEFQFNRFFKEIAFDAGLGLRLDFGFFVIRLDGAVPLKNPDQLPGKRWIFQSHDKIRVLGNLGIGYPF